MAEWELNFIDPMKCDYIHFKQIDENGLVLMEFALKYPDHGKLYYALADWFGDKVEINNVEQSSSVLVSQPSDGLSDADA